MAKLTYYARGDLARVETYDVDGKEHAVTFDKGEVSVDESQSILVDALEANELVSRTKPMKSKED